MSEIGLTDEEVNQYHDKGYIGPYRLFDEEKATSVLDAVTTHIEETDGHPSGRDDVDLENSRHLDSPEMYELASHPGIVERAADIYGDDLMLWSSRVWEKEPHGREFPWHQGDHFHPIEPPVTMTAWVALTEATEENGCCQVIPESHFNHVPHVQADEDKGFSAQAHPDMVDEEEAVSFELEPGEFFMFNERCLHRSLDNSTDEPRIGASVRLTLPWVKCYQSYGTMMVKGEDRMGLNDMSEPPVDK